LSTSGTVSPYTEVYSPSGGCSRQLASLPIGLWDFGLVLYGNNILACGGYVPSGSTNRNCWRYDVPTDNWISHSTLLYNHHRSTPFLVYSNKMYCVDYTNGESFSNVSYSWSLDLTSTANIGEGECSLQYLDSFYIFGGSGNVRYVQQYNFTTKQWTFPFTLNSGTLFSSCLLLPGSNGKALLLSIDSTNNLVQTTTIVDLVTYQQTPIATPNYQRAWGSNLVDLGRRIFVMNGWNWSTNVVVVEEYIPESNSWSKVTVPLIYPRHKSRTLSLPASWFSKIPGGCTGVV